MWLLKRTTVLLVIAAFLAFAATQSSSQQSSQPQTTPQPSPTPTEEPVKVFTEEVRLPVIALDAYGHYDPTLELDDILVLEDGVIQQLRSVRHIPANVLFLLDTGGDSTGLGGLSKSTSLTREVASRLVNRLQDGTSIAVMQSGNTAEMLQPWTTDKSAVLRTLKNKLLSTKRSRISDAIVSASMQLRERPEGSRHVVMITDGVDSPGGKVDRAEAMQTDRCARHNSRHQLHRVCKTEERQELFAGCCRSASTEFRSDHCYGSDASAGNNTLAVVWYRHTFRSGDDSEAQSV